MEVLTLIPHPNYKCSINKIMTLLVTSLELNGVNVATEIWSRHKDNESIIEKIFGRIMDIKKIISNLKSNHIDMMLLSTSHNFGTLIRDIPLILFSRKYCPKIVILFHGSGSNLLVSKGNVIYKLLSKIFVRSSDAIFLLSSQEITEWKEFYPDGVYFHVKYPYKRYSYFKNDGKKDRWGFPSHTSIILFVGRMVKEKGIFELLEAVNELSQEHQDISCVYVGNGPCLQLLENKVRQYSLDRLVIFTGFLEGDQLLDAYKNADLLVLPTYHQEGWPTVITEAMDAGLSIVTTSIRGSSDYLIDGENVLFVPAKNPEKLSQGIKILLDNEKLRRKMSEQNQKKLELFSPEVVGNQYKQLIQQIINSN